MSIIGSVLTLERTLPEGVLSGVLSGAYSVHGGVIRNASGHIVRHLVPAASQSLNPFGFISAAPNLYNTYQIHQLTEMTQQLLAISTATMAMSGLNLAVSAIGFKMLHDSLKQVEQRLDQLDKKVAWIKIFLDSARRARLLNAVEELSALPSDNDHRTHILHSSREKLGEVAMHYLQHWNEADELQEAMAYQHYYCMAFLAKSRCSAELGMYDNAVNEFQSGLKNWQVASRAVMTEQILGDNRARFLSKEYIEQAPAAKIAGWMDFAYDDKQGYGWIDILRQEYDSPSMLSFSIFSNKNEILDTQIEDMKYLDNLVSRNHVLQGYDSQLQFLADNKIKPSLLQAELNTLFEANEANEVLILAPTT